MMYLNDHLQICLLAVQSRCPKHTLHINTQVFGSFQFCSECWTASELIELLQEMASELLEGQACLVLNEQKCEIFLLKQSLLLPAIWIHCRGKIPAHTGDISVWHKHRAPITA